MPAGGRGSLPPSGADARSGVGRTTTSRGGSLQELRAALDPEVARSASGAFAVPAELRQLGGSAATTLYVATYGILNDLLPARGKQILAGVSAAHGGRGDPDFGAGYGAQAAEILLDAIARRTARAPR